VKIVRLLLTDLAHHLYGDEEEAEFDEEVDSMEATLGKLLAGGRAEGGDWELEEDQDLADEPASRLNLLVRGPHDGGTVLEPCTINYLSVPG